MCADHKSLLLGTALASTLLIGSLLISVPASAQVLDCADPGPDRVEYGGTAPITCVNTEFRDGDQPPTGDAIYLTTDTNPDSYITVNNSGELVGPLDGIDVRTETAGSYIDIVNSGTIFVGYDGIAARVTAIDSPILIDNSGAITAGDRGIFAFVEGINSPVDVINSAVIAADSEGIHIETIAATSPILIDNSGNVTSLTQEGIHAETSRNNSGISLFNTATVSGTDALEAETEGGNSPVLIDNDGRLIASESGIEATVKVTKAALQLGMPVGLLPTTTALRLVPTARKAPS